MKKLFMIALVSTSAIFSGIAMAHATALSPIGLWKTIDDVTEKPKAMVQLWEAQDKTLYGKILKVFPRPGLDLNPVCKECKGARHNQPLTGLVFLENLSKSKQSEIEWSGGKILDPKNGKTYNCTIQVADGGQKLNVRGYLGLPLFGRTQTWVRETA